MTAAMKEAEAAIKNSGHPELLKAVNGITDSTKRNAALLAQLATSLDPVLRDIGKRLQAAEYAIASLKNNYQ